jgi:hypothetical protein
MQQVILKYQKFIAPASKGHSNNGEGPCIIDVTRRKRDTMLTGVTLLRILCKRSMIMKARKNQTYPHIKYAAKVCIVFIYIYIFMVPRALAH